MKTTLLFEEKEVYGRTLYYPANEASRVLVSITDKKTMDSEQLNILRKIYNVEIAYNFQFKKLKK